MIRSFSTDENCCGFHMTFGNGYTASVSWKESAGASHGGQQETRTASVAAWDWNDDEIVMGSSAGDYPANYQDADDVARILGMVAGLPEVPASEVHVYFPEGPAGPWSLHVVNPGRPKVKAKLLR